MFVNRSMEPVHRLHGQALWSQPVGPGPSSRHRIPNQWGVTHIQTMVRTDRHTFGPLFSPLTSAKNPCFYPKIVSQSLLFFPHTLSKILEIFHSKTPNRLEFEKNLPKCPLFLWLLSLKDPLFFALHAHVWEECCSLKYGLQKLENFVFLKQNRAIWWILLGANLIKVMKTKFQFYGLNRPNCTLWMNFIGGQGCTGHHPSGQTRKGIYPTTTLCMIVRNLHGSLNKCQEFVRLCKWRHFKCKLQCRARWRARENFEI